MYLILHTMIGKRCGAPSIPEEINFRKYLKIEAFFVNNFIFHVIPTEDGPGYLNQSESSSLKVYQALPVA